MNIDWNILVDVGMPIITLFLGVLVNHLIENRPKLVTHLGYISCHKFTSQPKKKDETVVNSHSIIIKNASRKVVRNVRLGHNFLPNVYVYPDIEYHIKNLPAGGKEIIFPTIVPKKEIVVSYLYFPPNTWDQINTYVESDDGPAKEVKVLLQTQPPTSLLIVLWVLIIVGFITLFYGGIKFIQLFL